MFTPIEQMRSQTNNSAPSIEQLYSALLAQTKSLDRAYVLFDALDECDAERQRRQLLPLFHRMHADGMNVFVTSRQHPEDIQDSFCESPKMELSPHEQDVQSYIQNRIDTDARMRALVQKGKCKDRIVAELTKQAMGM